ncbi:MAG: hypothetical protein DRH90_21180 [Deltaproteobacteria bacterium]|nr:MAG: hypothetical protein DRH90_21180 [Deltaproteobacteria bacterium]
MWNAECGIWGRSVRRENLGLIKYLAQITRIAQIQLALRALLRFADIYCCRQLKADIDNKLRPKGKLHAKH